MADAAVPTKRPLFDDFGYYIRWWLLLGAIGGLLTVVGSEDLDHFGRAKLIQVIWGLGSGVLFAVVFTPIQNLLNAGRKRWLTWVIAIAAWLGVKFAVGFATLA